MISRAAACALPHPTKWRCSMTGPDGCAVARPAPRAKARRALATCRAVQIFTQPRSSIIVLTTVPHGRGILRMPPSLPPMIQPGAAVQPRFDCDGLEIPLPPRSQCRWAGIRLNIDGDGGSTTCPTVCASTALPGSCKNIEHGCPVHSPLKPGWRRTLLLYRFGSRI